MATNGAMRFGVLGSLLVADARGRWLRLHSGRQRSLLAVLLFEANQYVPAEKLVDAMWQGSPPRSYRSNLQTYVSRLRERIGAGRIDYGSGGYRLCVEDDEVDLLVFRAEANRGRQAVRAGDAQSAAKHLRLALAQWRDRPLADVDLPTLDAERSRLDAERLAVFEDCLEAELAVGRHVELVGELRAAVAEEPLSERLAGLLMVALQRSGRQAEALAAYRDTRTVLIEEMGIEPGPELRHLHATMLRGEPVDPGPVPVAWPIFQVPTDIADFSGRDETVQELIAALGREPLVVLSGEPGVGKSTLAVRVGHRLRDAFPDGQLFAHLAGASSPRDPAAVLAEWLSLLGTPASAIPVDLQARAAVFRAKLADRAVLVLLDDAADPAQVRPLLPGGPGCAVLVTSRRRLSGLAGVYRVPVQPLTNAEAGLLLARIAGERVIAQPVDAARIAAACGNLPLALRIAGTRLALRPHLRLGVLADKLEDELHRLDELVVNDLQVRSSLALSYRALTRSARTTLQLFGIVDIPNLSALAITVLRGGSDSDGAVEELIEASLLEPAGVDSTGEPRYQMHDVVRAFARELALSADGLAEREIASNRLVETAFALSDLAAQQLPRAMPAPQFSGPAPGPRVAEDVVRQVLADPEAWFASERRSIVAGLGVLCRVRQHRKAMQVFERFGRYLWLHGHYDDLRCCADSLVTAARAAHDEQVEARAAAILALLLQVRGRYADADRAYRLAAVQLRRFGDRPAEAWALVNLATCQLSLGRSEAAVSLVAQAEALFEDDDFGTISALRTRSGALHRLGRSAEAVSADTQALALARRRGEPLIVALALQSLSWSRAVTGDLASAATLAEEAVALLRPTTARSALARSLRALGTINAGSDQRIVAITAFREALTIATELDEQPRVVSCTRAIAASWIGEGRAQAAIPELHRCLQTYREMSNRPAETVTLRLLAAAYDAVADSAAAAHAIAEADRTSDPRDASTSSLLRMLLNLTQPV